MYSLRHETHKGGSVQARVRKRSNSIIQRKPFRTANLRTTISLRISPAVIHLQSRLTLRLCSSGWEHVYAGRQMDLTAAIAQWIAEFCQIIQHSFKWSYAALRQNLQSCVCLFRCHVLLFLGSCCQCYWHRELVRAAIQSATLGIAQIP